jgi:hypothetical protein
VDLHHVLVEESLEVVILESRDRHSSSRHLDKTSEQSRDPDSMLAGLGHSFLRPISSIEFHQKGVKDFKALPTADGLCLIQTERAAYLGGT